MRNVSITPKEARADVRVRVGNAVVVDVEQPVVGVLAVVTADVDARVRRVEVPVIARRTGETHRRCTDSPVAPYGADFFFPIFFLYFLVFSGHSPPFCEGDYTPPRAPLSGKFLEARADVHARVRHAVVVDKEQPEDGDLPVETANKDAGVRRAEVPVIARIGVGTAAVCRRNK